MPCCRHNQSQQFQWLAAAAARLSPEGKTGPVGRVRFSGLVWRLDVGSYVELAHFLEQRRARHTKQLRSLVDAAAGACQHRANVAPLGLVTDLREGSKQVSGPAGLRLQRKERF